MQVFLEAPPDNSLRTAWRGLALGVATVVQTVPALAESSWLHTFDLFGPSQDDPVRRVEKRSGTQFMGFR